MARSLAVSTSAFFTEFVILFDDVIYKNVDSTLRHHQREHKGRITTDMPRENPMELPEFTEIFLSISIYFFFNLQTGRTFFTTFNIQQEKPKLNSKYKSKLHASKMWQFCLKLHFLNLGSCFISDLTRISMLSNVNQRTSKYS